MVARQIDLPRISVFTIEKMENRLVALFQIPGYERFLILPDFLHINDKLKITTFYHENTSLYELLHDKNS